MCALHGQTDHGPSVTIPADVLRSLSAWRCGRYQLFPSAQGKRSTTPPDPPPAKRAKDDKIISPRTGHPPARARRPPARGTPFTISPDTENEEDDEFVDGDECEEVEQDEDLSWYNKLRPRRETESLPGKVRSFSKLDCGRVPTTRFSTPQQRDSLEAALVQRLSDILFKRSAQTLAMARNQDDEPPICNGFAATMAVLVEESAACDAYAQKIVDHMESNTAATLGRDAFSYPWDLDDTASLTDEMFRGAGVYGIWIETMDGSLECYVGEVTHDNGVRGRMMGEYEVTLRDVQIGVISSNFEGKYPVMSPPNDILTPLKGQMLRSPAAQKTKDIHLVHASTPFLLTDHNKYVTINCFHPFIQPTRPVLTTSPHP